MPLAVFVPMEYQSSYGLLGQMAREIGDALGRAGAEINPDRGCAPGEPRVYLFFNFPADMAVFETWTRPDIPGGVVLHIFVDHPFALEPRVLDALVRNPSYRLLLPSLDDLHLIPLRWPGIRAATLPHAVGPHALLLAKPDVEKREFDVVLAGSISSNSAITAARSRIPAAIRTHADAAAEMLVARPTMPFTAAFDACSPSGLTSSDHWTLLRDVWAYVTARVNRARRTAVATSMQGLRTLVLGSREWEPLCRGSVVYGDHVSYAELPGHLQRANVCAAWNPTQFVLTHSERVLLGMAAGCATITDDRPGLRRALGGEIPVEFTRATDDAEGFRAAADRLLADEARMRGLGEAGRAKIESSQLWDHRVPLIASVIESVLTARTK